ncbi:MAG: hypothetical protein GXY44_08725 [Phycisphaerales bacterium]|nr:hypothetical protein [Phycisphaerales bacterium]
MVVVRILLIIVGTGFRGCGGCGH